MNLLKRITRHAKKQNPDNPVPVEKYLGYGVVPYEQEVRDYDEDADEWDYHYETVRVEGNITHTEHYVRVSDDAGGTLFIPHCDVDPFMACSDKAAFESYWMDVELQRMAGGEAD